MTQDVKSDKEEIQEGRREGKNAPVQIPIYRKLLLTIREAAEYSNIGINKLDSLLRAPNCPFVLFVGTKKLVKRKEFEEYIAKTLSI